LYGIYDQIGEELGSSPADIEALIEVYVIYPWVNSVACASAIGDGSSRTMTPWDRKMQVSASLAARLLYGFFLLWCK
jgi:hypothetical protein